MTKYYVTILNNHRGYKAAMNDIAKVYKQKRRSFPQVPRFEEANVKINDYDLLTNSGDSELEFEPINFFQQTGLKDQI